MLKQKNQININKNIFLIKIKEKNTKKEMSNRTPIKSRKTPIKMNSESADKKNLLLYTNFISYNLNDKKKNQSDYSSSDSDSDNKLNGRWSEEEQRLFIRGCILFNNDWKLVKKYVKTRSLKQIQKHAEKYLLKLIKKYFEDKDDYKKFDLDLKLTEQEKKILIEKKQYDEGEQGIAELYILCNFKKKSKNYELQKNLDRNKDMLGLIEDNYYNKSTIENTENNSNSEKGNYYESITSYNNVEIINNLLDSSDINDLFKLISYNSETNRFRENEIKLLNRYREIALKYYRQGVLHLINVGEEVEKEENIKRLERINKKKEKMMEKLNPDNKVKKFMKKNRNRRGEDWNEGDEDEEENEFHNLIHLDEDYQIKEQTNVNSQDSNFINIEDDESIEYSNKKRNMNKQENEIIIIE